MAIRKRSVFILISLYIFIAQLFFVIHFSNEVSDSATAGDEEDSAHSKAVIYGAQHDASNGNEVNEILTTTTTTTATLERNEKHCIFKYENDCTQMRVSEQLDYKPQVDESKKTKTILLYGGFGGWEGGLTGPKSVFETKQCRVQNCQLIGDMRQFTTADAVIFRNEYSHADRSRHSAHQTWIIYLLESPYNAHISAGVQFNWTASYRLDSTVVTPYSWWRPIENPQIEKNRNYAKGKTKFAAWFVSHCGTQNRRLEFARKLQQYVPIDIYGTCGNMRCDRSKAECWNTLDTDYKFYIAFENSNCRDYITEKFFENALSHNVLPIVMGPPRIDYERVSPPKSFIHVEDFPTARELADYLIKLNQTDQL